MHEVRTSSSKTNGVRKQRLLIGESNPAVRDYLVAILGADGHEVVAMASGIDLLDTLAVSLHPEFGSGHFDLVISQARMLGAEDARVFSKLVDRAILPPFVFTTVFGDTELQVKAKQFGALAVLDNPLDIDELREVVNSFLNPRTEDRGQLVAGATAWGIAGAQIRQHGLLWLGQSGLGPIKMVGSIHQHDGLVAYW